MLVVLLSVNVSSNLLLAQVNRSIDGTLNHPLFYWGAVLSDVQFKTSAAFGDGISSPAGQDRPNARQISNLVMREVEEINDPLGLSAFTWAFGQFIDHDIVLTPSGTESFPIQVPTGDPFFDPMGSGTQVIGMHRSKFSQNSGTDQKNPRTFFNEVTAFIDGSAVYGSDAERAHWLRTLDDGKLKTSNGNLLPFNTIDGEQDSSLDPNAPEMDMPFPGVSKWFVAGDVRANENPLLTAMHTLFVREHNRICDSLSIANDGWNDEDLYQRARKLVGALIQAIVYEEWLPAMGVTLPEYTEYTISVEPNIFNEFAAAAYRFGHSTVNKALLRLDNQGNPLTQGDIELRRAFFNPSAITEVGGVEPFLSGAVKTLQSNVDCQIVDDLRNFLFGAPGSGGLDLASLNIQRGRDRGVPDFNTVRKGFGLPIVESFSEVTLNSRLDQALSEVYGGVEDVDLWVGVLAEDHYPQSAFGPTIRQVMIEQFFALREGDRYYYENDPSLSREEKALIKGTRLHDLLRRNTSIQIISDNAFKAQPGDLLANRTIDGTLNNPHNSNWGAAETRFAMHTPIAYEDGFSTPGGIDRPNARFISNEIFTQLESKEDPHFLSAYTWAWGQFIDHDITLSRGNNELLEIEIPAFDAYFDPQGTGTQKFVMHRSEFDERTGTDPTNPRVHINGITAFIDGSAVYGSDDRHAAWLRTFQHGKLKTSEGNLLPYNTVSGERDDEVDPNAPHMEMPFAWVDRHFVAGDVRANENPFLTGIHTIFVREHNRLCDEILSDHPDWTDELVYQRARKIVGALIQSVVYEEWLPTLGMVVPRYKGYNATVDPAIMNVFATAAYRYGHTTINSTLKRMDDHGNPMPGGDLELRRAFFNPDAINEVGGIEAYLAGMSFVVQQDFDCHVVDELRNFLFGAPGSGGLDLVSLNIARGRERGLADYNTIRKSFGLDVVETFANVSSDPRLNQKFATVYGDVSKIDPWVGMLAEEHLEGSLFGSTVMTIIEQQFMGLRDGDRFYYEVDPVLTSFEKEEIKNTRLSDIIRRNTGMSIIQDEIFIAQSVSTAVAEVDNRSLDFNVFPNPTVDKVQVQLSSGVERSLDDWKVEIYDLQGRSLFATYERGDVDQLSIDLDGYLSAGQYLMMVSKGKLQGITPLIKAD